MLRTLCCELFYYDFCSSLISDRDGSEDESLFSLHRHSSFGRDSDTEESRKDSFPMHRLRYGELLAQSKHFLLSTSY